MVLYTVDISKTAKEDIVSLFLYIAVELNAPETALIVKDTIKQSLFGLEHMPHKCSLVEDERLAILGYRKLLIKNYLAFFTIDEETKTVTVERILYVRRDWLHIL